MPGFPESFKYYDPIHFRVQELVGPNVYTDMGENAIQLLDWRLLYSLDCLREYLNVPLIVNDWMWGGKNTLRGFRPPNDTVGAALSQHKFGRAADFVSPKMSAEDMRVKIQEGNRLFPFITYMENGKIEGKDERRGWVHCDIRASKHNGIHLFKP